MAARGVVQAVILGAGAFVIGLVVGGLGPRAQVRELQDRVFELERTQSRDPGAGRELARLLTAGVGATAADTPDDGADVALAEPSAPPPEEPRPFGKVDVGDGTPLRVEGVPEGVDPLEAAREALALRRTQAMAALEEDVAPDAGQRAVFESAIDEMNEDLLALAKDFVAQSREHGEPDRRELMTAAADVLDVLVRTEDRFLGAMTPEQRDAVRPESTDPASFVDPVVVETLMELEELRR